MSHHQGRTAVYRFYDHANQLLYVGISNNPASRWVDHAADKPWWGEVAMREIEWFATRQEAERQEAELIGDLDPRYNRAPGMPDPSAMVNPVKAARRPGWEPPTQLRALFGRYEEEQKALAATRDELEAAIVAEMRTGVSANRLAKFFPWEIGTFRKIGQRAHVPRLRESTVISARLAAQSS